MFFDRQRMFHKRDRLRQLRAFCRAARLESITKAAESLGISQPAVSLHVRELENELEAILFDRSGPRISLTHAGKCLYEFAEPLVKGMDSLSVNFMEMLDDQITGHVHMAASHTGISFVLPPYFKRFRDRYPGVTLSVRTCQIHDGLKMLVGDEVEFAFGVGDSYTQDELDFHEVTTYQMVLIGAADHPLVGREAVSPQEAAAWPAIIPTPGTYGRQFADTATRQFGIDVKVAIEVGGWDVIKHYVESGLGIAVVPSLCVTESDRLSVIPIQKTLPYRSYGVFTRRGKFLTPPSRRLIEMLTPSPAHMETSTPGEER